MLFRSTFGIDRAALTKAISDAKILIGSKKVGKAVGKVSKKAKDDFQSAITVATVVNTNATVNQAEVDAQVLALREATINFNKAVKVPGDGCGHGKSHWRIKI